MTARGNPGRFALLWSTCVSKQPRGLEFRVGVLLLAAAAILVAFVMVLGNFSFRSGYSIKVDYDYVGSLQVGAPVKISGIKVGKVSDVEFFGGRLDPETQQRVQVRVT